MIVASSVILQVSHHLLTLSIRQGHSHSWHLLLETLGLPWLARHQYIVALKSWKVAISRFEPSTSLHEVGSTTKSQALGCRFWWPFTMPGKFATWDSATRFYESHPLCSQPLCAGQVSYIPYLGKLFRTTCLVVSSRYTNQDWRGKVPQTSQTSQTPKLAIVCNC